MQALVHALVILAAGALCAALAAAAAAVVLPVLRARWRAAGRGARALFALAAAAATYYGGSKSIGRVSYPATDSGTAYLVDVGSSVTNDAVVLNFTRSSLVPDDAWLWLDACPLSVTDPAEVAANCVTVYSNQFSAIALPLAVPCANATNFNFYAYTDWTPGPVVHTNGVVNVNYRKKLGEMPPNAVQIVPVRTQITVPAGE